MGEGLVGVQQPNRCVMLDSALFNLKMITADGQKSLIDYSTVADIR